MSARIQLAPVLLLAVALATAAGCRQVEREDVADAAATTESETTMADGAVAATDEVERAQAVLAVADVADGTEDRVVEKCAGCNLHMAGKAEHSVDVLGYELHQCSAYCKERFEKEPVESVLAMSIEVDDGGADG